MDLEHEILKNVHVAQNYSRSPQNASPFARAEARQFIRFGVRGRQIPSSVVLFRSTGFSNVEVLGISRSFYRVAGRGTDWLSKRRRRKAGHSGSPWQWFHHRGGAGPIVLVSRGIRIAPLCCWGRGEEERQEEEDFLSDRSTSPRRESFMPRTVKSWGRSSFILMMGAGVPRKSTRPLAHLLKERKILKGSVSMLWAG
jgi:NAD(P)H-flavin reductase